MSSLFEALRAVAQRLPGTVMGVATGGGEDAGTGYLYVDDAVLLTLYDDDAFVGGALMITGGDADGAVLSVRDSVQSTGRVLGEEQIWSQSGSETPAAGDLYLVTPGIWPVARLLAGVQEALRAWGTVATEESVGTGDGETASFTLSAVAGSEIGEVIRVYLTNDDGDERTEMVRWEQDGDTLTFEEAPPDGYAITALVRWPAEAALTLPPTRETLDDDVLEPPVEWLGWYGAYACLRAGVGVPGQDGDMLVRLMNYALEQAQAAGMAARVEATGAERLMR